MDLGDTVLAKAIGNRLIHSLRMQEQLSRVRRDGKRKGVSVWQLPKRDEHPSSLSDLTVCAWRRLSLCN
jgi:hypothetical protein